MNIICDSTWRKNFESLKKILEQTPWLSVAIPLERFFGYYKNSWLNSAEVQDAIYIFDQLIQRLLENMTSYYKWNIYTSQKYRLEL